MNTAFQPYSQSNASVGSQHTTQTMPHSSHPIASNPITSGVKLNATLQTPNQELASSSSSATSSAPLTFPPTLSCTPIEAKCQETFAYYQAYITDIDPAKESLLVMYENEWKPSEWVLYEDCRLAAPSFDPAQFNPARGTVVEAMAKSSDDEPYSWWAATVKNVKGDFFMISYASWEDEFNEILEKEMLRPMNPHPNLTNDELQICHLVIPQDLWSTLTTDNLHTIRQSSQCLTLAIDHTQHRVKLIGVPSSVKRACALLGMAFKHLSEIQKLQRLRASHESDLQSLQKRMADGHCEEWKCSPALMGLVIGKKGHNVRQAESLNGVMHIKVDNATATITVLAVSEEVAKQARALLEFTEERLFIPKSLLGRVVGKGFAHLREVEERTGVSRIRVESEGEERNGEKPPPVDQRIRRPQPPLPVRPEDDPLVTLLLIGTQSSVCDARCMIELQIGYLRELHYLNEDEKLAADKVQQLNKECGTVVDYRRSPSTTHGDVDYNEAPSMPSRGSSNPTPAVSPAPAPASAPAATSANATPAATTTPTVVPPSAVASSSPHAKGSPHIANHTPDKNKSNKSNNTGSHGGSGGQNRGNVNRGSYRPVS